MYNNILVACDTDGISVCKFDGSPFSIEERNFIRTKLNEQFHESVKWGDDGYYSKFIVLKTKNYIMMDENDKITYKGSSLKSASLEPALKEFLKEIINSLLHDKNDFQEIYYKYVKMIHNIKDIAPWCSKRTISDKTLNNDRENEAKVRRSIEGTEYVEGDRIYVYFKEGKELGLRENFKGDHDKKALLKKLYKATDRFTTVLDSNMFLDFSLKKKNQKELEDVLWNNDMKKIINDT